MNKNPKKPYRKKDAACEFLFLDNFRGFNNILIPFRDVTFLVGENSTGKSSVISVLHLIRNFSFWHEPDFDSDDQHLGGFNDLVTAESTRPDEFIIGTARYAQTFTSKRQPLVIFATFTNKEGLPHISKLSFMGRIGLITVFDSSDGVFYTFDEIRKLDASMIEMPYVNAVADCHKKASLKSASKLNINSDTSYSGLPLYHLIAVVENHLLREKEKKKTKEEPNTLSSIYNFMTPMDSAVWLAPIRTKPRRTYDGTKKAFSAEGDHTPYLLKKQLTGDRDEGKRFRELIGELGKNSHLFQDIRINNFGNAESAPFEVQVNLGGIHLGLSNVGYGVSQVLPILVEVVAREEASVFHIQQPEVHLHPRAQAALGDLFYALAKDEKKRFVIETHSDYLIDRLRSAMRDDAAKNPETLISVVFFSRKDGENTTVELMLSSEGGYPSEQPAEFRDFFIHEQFRNLGI